MKLLLLLLLVIAHLTICFLAFGELHFMPSSLAELFVDISAVIGFLFIIKLEDPISKINDQLKDRGKAEYDFYDDVQMNRIYNYYISKGFHIVIKKNTIKTTLLIYGKIK